MSRMRTAALMTAAATLVAAGCTSSHPSGVSSRVQRPASTTTTTTRTVSVNPKQAAVALGKRMLDRAILPPGAQVSTAPPPAHLQSPQQQPAMGNLVFAHRLWSVPGSPDDVQHWLEGHVPAGFVRRGTGSTSGPGYRIVGVEDDLQRLPANTSTAEMQLAVIAAGSGSMVRVDTLVGWTAPRPANEFVPAKDRVVTVQVVRAFAPRPVPVLKTVVVTDPRLVGPIVKSFNALAVSPPNAVHGCPALSSRTVGYRIAFSTAPNAKPGITASIGACGGVAVTVGGHPAPPLGEFSSGYGAFADAVAHVFGLAHPHFD